MGAALTFFDYFFALTQKIIRVWGKKPQWMDQLEIQPDIHKSERPALRSQPFFIQSF